MEDDKFYAGLTTLFVIGVITCGFFWVSSCQRTEIIDSCLRNLKTPDCIKEMK